MPGQRQPASWGLQPQPGTLDQGTSCLVLTPAPRSVGFDGAAGNASGRSSPRGTLTMVADRAVETAEDLSKALSDFQRSETWSSLQPIAFRLLGQYSFGLGVVYGIGENVVTSVVELLQLVKTFLLADLYDRAQQPVFSAASLNPVALVQRLLAEVSMRTFAGALEEAHREREALIEELRYAMTNIGEVLGSIKEGYVAKWNRFETLVGERRFSSQFHAGRIFGEVLIEVVSLIGGGTAAVRAAGKIPRLAKLARLKIPPKSTAYGRAAKGAAAREAPVTPSQTRPSAPATETVPKKSDVYVVDKEGVPIGARPGRAPRGLPDVALKKDGWPDLPAEHAANFTSAEPVTLKPGTKIYRIIDDEANPAGSYWSEKLPASRAEWRGDYAVKPGWNTNGKYVEYTVPDGPGLNVWRGATAAQDLEGSAFHLPGGGQQIYMPRGTVTPGAPKPTGW